MPKTDKTEHTPKLAKKTVAAVSEFLLFLIYCVFITFLTCLLTGRQYRYPLRKKIPEWWGGGWTLKIKQANPFNLISFLKVNC